MSELDQCQQKIDRFLQNNNFKQAINYVTSLKQSGMSPENVSYLQVYISKKMNQSLSKHIQEPKKKLSLKTESNQDAFFPRYLQNKSTRFENQSQLFESDPKNPPSVKRFNDYPKLDNNCFSSTLSKFDDINSQMTKRSSIKDGNQKPFMGNFKVNKSVVKLPSLNSLENEKYNQLKQIVKESLKDLNGKINQKYFKSNALLDQANFYNKQKEYDKAIEYYDQAMEVDTNNINILVGKGDCLRKQGQYEAALECYEYGMNLNPPHKYQFKILFNKGNIYKCMGKNKEAIECYSKASLLDPQNPNTYFNKALAFYSLGELDEVIDNYSRVVKQNPRDQHALLNKGMALREIGEFGPAVECFVKASEMKARNARQYLNKGNALFQIDKLEDALACYKKAIMIENNFYEAYLNMGVVLNELGRTVEEIECYKIVLQLKPDDVKALYNQAVALREIGEVEESVKQFDKVIQINPKMVNAYINKGLSQYILGKFKESYDSYYEALKIDSNSIESYINMSQCLRQMKKSSKALKLLMKALKISPNNFELHFQIGEIFKQILNIKKALEYYSYSIQLNPIYSEAIFQKGVCLQIINELESANKCFDLCIKFNPSNPKPHINKGQIYEVQGKLKSALRQYDIAVTLKNGQETDDLALLCKAHAYRERVGEESKLNAIEIYHFLIDRKTNNPNTKFQAYLGYSAIIIREIIINNLKALGRFSPVTDSYQSSQISSLAQMSQVQINQQNQQSQFIQINLKTENDTDRKQQKLIQTLSGAEIEDAYFHLFCLLASEIERMTTFAAPEIQKIQDEQKQDFTLTLLLRYLNLKKKQGVNYLGMGNAKHIIYMILSYIYIGLKKRERKEFDESILYFEFLMNLDKDLEIFCRYQSFISYLQSNYFQNNKKMQFPFSEVIAKGSASEIYGISFDKNQINENELSEEDTTKQQTQSGQQQHQQKQQQIRLSNISKQLLENFEKELVCRKIKSAVFKTNKDQYYKQFAIQNILNHRNIQKINYMYFDQEENINFIEQRQKYNLEAHLHQYIVSFEQRLNILLQISQAVQYLHSNGILHGNICMKNILIRNNDFIPLITGFSNSRIILSIYHSSSFWNIQQSNTKQPTLFFSANHNPNNFISPDLTISLADDIYALGQVFEKMLLKIDQQDRMINNWYKKGFMSSLSLQKLVRNMLDHNKVYKRPDITRVVETLQFESIAAMLYNIYQGPFQSLAGIQSITSSASKNNSQVFSQMGGLNNQNLKNVMNTHSLSGNNSGIATPANNNVSTLTLLQQQQQQIQHQNIVDSNQYSHVQTPINSLPNNQNVKLSRKQIKKVVPYQIFASELEDIRQYYKQTMQLKVISMNDVNTILTEKMAKVLNFQYVYVQDLLNRDLFLNSLNDVNINFLVIIIKQIQDCSQSDQIKLIQEFLGAIKERNKRLETENIYQYSQASLLYRLIGRSDPEKYRYKLMQKLQFKDEYINIASVFLSDGIEFIENSLRVYLLDSLPTLLFQLSKANLNNFTFPNSHSIQKKKLAIIEMYLEVISPLQISQNEIDKIAKDTANHQKLLQILKFDGYLRSVGDGVYELLFKPLREIIEKIFIYQKGDNSVIDQSSAPQISAKDYYKQKIRAIVELEKEIEKIKESAKEYLTTNIAKKSGVNLVIDGAEDNLSKKSTTATSYLDNKLDKNLGNEIQPNYGQKKTDKKSNLNLSTGLSNQGKGSNSQLNDIDDKVQSNEVQIQLNQKPKQNGESNPNEQNELYAAPPRSIVSIVVDEADKHIRQVKLYKQQLKEQNNEDSTNRDMHLSTRNTTNNQSKTALTQPNTDRKSKKNLSDRKNQSPTKPIQKKEETSSSNNIQQCDDKKSPIKLNNSQQQSQINPQNQQNQLNQNQYLASCHADLVEEENYNQFIKNHLKQTIFGDSQQEGQNNQNSHKQNNSKKLQFSFNNIQSDDNDEDDSDEELDQIQSIVINNNYQKNQQKLATIGGGNLKNQQNQQQSNKEKKNLAVEQIKMKKLNFSGISSGESMIQLQNKSNSSTIQNSSPNADDNKNQKEEDEVNLEGKNDQTEIKKQFKNQNGNLNPKISLMENVFSVNFTDLKTLYEKSINL
ncbi:hypothetical protein ABPG72_013960 [Tetrahymena utriculariae]